MKRLWDQLRRRRAQVATHPFFTWLNSDATSLEQRFVFAPVMIDFIMGFADMNKWFFRYPDPQSDQERAINEHTEEDGTHSQLFYENWYTLDLADAATWPPGKVLWWMFHSKDSDVIRRFGMEILDLAVNNQDPLVRFSMMEAIEVCGDVFFANTAPIAELLSKRHGADQRYFGQFHRERETGHLHTDETVFLRTRLTTEHASKSAQIVDRIFDTFLAVLDSDLSYAQRAVSDEIGLARDLEDEYQLALDGPRAVSKVVERPPSPFSVSSESQRPALQRLNERLGSLQRNPLLGWLHEDDGMSPREKLQCFTALWGVDIVGYKDFNKLVLRYPTPGSEMERSINRWTDNLAAHSAMYLQDWRALAMDSLLGWNAGETIAFYFLGPQTEIHRRNMAKVKQYAFRYTQPVLRWWLMTALESSGKPLFAHTQKVAELAEEEDGMTLNYWANRHSLAHPVAEGAPDDSAFLGEEIAPTQCELVCQMIDTVFDNVEEQFSLSYEMATSRLFVREPASLPPPPRYSGIVELAPGRASHGRRQAG